MSMTQDPARDYLIALLDEKCGYVSEQKAEVLADKLLDNGVALQKFGKWFKEQLPVPKNAKNTTMEHYRLVCPFCGRRNGKKRERFCADCGAMLR